MTLNQGQNKVNISSSRYTLTPDVSRKEHLSSVENDTCNNNYVITTEEHNDHFKEMVISLNCSKEITEILQHYSEVYQRNKEALHPKLKMAQWKRIIAELEKFKDEWCLDVEGFKEMIDYHFKRRIRSDFNINHFATKGILENLLYKTLY